MSTLDDELLKDAEDDAREIAFIHNYLPQELKDKFTEDELYYFMDVIFDYYSTSDIFDATPDKDGYVEIDLEEVADYVVKKAKKEGMGSYSADDLLFVVQAEMEYSNAETQDD